jgi:predicted small secreted protein
MEIPMHKSGRNVMTALIAVALVAGLSACQKEEGPAERAGKAMDNAVKQAGEQIEKAGEKIQQAAEEAKK